MYEDVNPVALLYERIATDFPLQESGSVFHAIDSALESDGELLEHLHQSTIGFVIRRLVGAASIAELEIDAAGLGDIELRKKLKALVERYGFNRKSRPIIAELLFQCVLNRRVNAAGTLREARQRSRKSRTARCYICGGALAHHRHDTDDRCSADHFWPRALGGPTDQENLRAACRRCNSRKKQSFATFPDYHYERWMPHLPSDHPSFQESFRWNFAFAVVAKSQFACVRCQVPTASFGSFVMGRRDEDEPWHLFNVDAYCTRCQPAGAVPLPFG